jgi:hypothetical protein
MDLAFCAPLTAWGYLCAVQDGVRCGRCHEMRSGEREVDASAGHGGASDGGVRGSERGCVHDMCGSTGLAPD